MSFLKFFLLSPLRRRGAGGSENSRKSPLSQTRYICGWPLIGGWLLMAVKIYRWQNLSCRFEDWLHEHKQCTIKRQTSYNCRNLFKLMSVAPKLMSCRVNVTYYFKNYEFFLNILLMKHKHPGNVSFFVHVKIVFLTFLL